MFGTEVLIYQKNLSGGWLRFGKALVWSDPNCHEICLDWSKLHPNRRCSTILPPTNMEIDFKVTEKYYWWKQDTSWLFSSQEEGKVFLHQMVGDWKETQEFCGVPARFGLGTPKCIGFATCFGLWLVPLSSINWMKTCKSQRSKHRKVKVKTIGFNSSPFQQSSDLHLCLQLPPNPGLLLALFGGHWWSQPWQLEPGGIQICCS